MVDLGILVSYTKPLVQPHEPEKILDFHELRTQNHARHQVLVKWKDMPDARSTWENISTLKKQFPTSFFAEKKSSFRGE